MGRHHLIGHRLIAETERDRNRLRSAERQVERRHGPLRRIEQDVAARWITPGEKSGELFRLNLAVEPE